MEALEVPARPTVLVIDDSRTVVAALRKLFESHGYTVVAFDSLAEVPVYVARETPCAIVLDIEMPGLSGRQMAEQIRRASRAPVPIVVYSGRSEREIRENSYLIGAYGYLKKGGDPAELVYMVQTAVAGTPLAPASTRPMRMPPSS